MASAACVAAADRHGCAYSKDVEAAENCGRNRSYRPENKRIPRTGQRVYRRCRNRPGSVGVFSHFVGISP